jgi:hypothetical protein
MSNNNFHHRLTALSGLVLLAAGCSSAKFENGQQSAPAPKAAKVSNPQPESAGVENGTAAVVGVEDVITVKPGSFTGSQQTLMFRGTRGANLKSMVVGAPLNQADVATLSASGGLLVVSGLVTGATYNEWGLFAKTVSPEVTTKTFTERRSVCLDNEILVGLPDRGSDATNNPAGQAIVASWNNKYICATLQPNYTIISRTDVPYTHNYNMSVNCPDDLVMTGYSCGSCSPPAVASLKCAKIGIKP